MESWRERRLGEGSGRERGRIWSNGGDGRRSGINEINETEKRERS